MFKWRKTTGEATLQRQIWYLESVAAADVVVGLDRRDDITGQGNAAQHRLLSAVWKEGEDSRAQSRNDQNSPKQTRGT